MSLILPSEFLQHLVIYSDVCTIDQSNAGRHKQNEALEKSNDPRRTNDDNQKKLTRKCVDRLET